MLFYEYVTQNSHFENFFQQVQQIFSFYLFDNLGGPERDHVDFKQGLAHPTQFLVTPLFMKKIMLLYCGTKNTWAEFGDVVGGGETKRPTQKRKKLGKNCISTSHNCFLWEGGGGVETLIFVTIKKRKYVSIPERSEDEIFLNMILNEKKVHFSKFHHQSSGFYQRKNKVYGRIISKFY